MSSQRSPAWIDADSCWAAHRCRRSCGSSRTDWEVVHVAHALDQRARDDRREGQRLGAVLLGDPHHQCVEARQDVFEHRAAGITARTSVGMMSPCLMRPWRTAAYRRPPTVPGGRANGPGRPERSMRLSCGLSMPSQIGKPRSRQGPNPPFEGVRQAESRTGTCVATSAAQVHLCLEVRVKALVPGKALRPGHDATPCDAGRQTMDDALNPRRWCVACCTSTGG